MVYNRARNKPIIGNTPRHLAQRKGNFMSIVEKMVGSWVSMVTTYTAPFESRKSPPGYFIVEVYKNTDSGMEPYAFGRYVMYHESGRCLGRGVLHADPNAQKEEQMVSASARDDGGGSQVAVLWLDEQDHLVWRVEFVASGGSGAPIGATMLERSSDSFEQLDNNLQS